MSKYNQPLSKQEALQLKKSNPKVVAYYPECSDTNDIVVNIVPMEDWDLNFKDSNENVGNIILSNSGVKNNLNKDKEIIEDRLIS